MSLFCLKSLEQAIREKMISSTRLALVNVFGGLIFGYNTGVIAGVLNLEQWKKLSEIDAGILTCSILVGAALGSIFGGVVTEKLGRKRPMMIIGLLTVAGALASALVPSDPFWYIVASRLVLGLGVGASGIVCPTYVGEMASADRKGTLGTIFQIAITIGIFIGDVIGYSFKNVEYNYRWMFAFGAIPGILLLVLSFMIPESSVWIDKQSSHESSQLMLNKDQSSKVGIGALLSSRMGRFSLFIGCVLAINNQLTGINAFMYFSPSIFETAGITGDNGPMIATMCLVGWNVITTFIATFMINRIGRRRLMLYSSVVMIVSCLGLALLFLLVKGTTLGILSIVLLFVFIAGFEAGAGPLFWMMAIEIFPEEMRDIGSSLLNALQWIFNIALSFSFLSLVKLIGQSAIFWIFGGTGIGCLIIMFFYLPDTQHQSNEYKPID
eukprot:gene3518-4021_t